MIVACSFAKNFGLYGERVGALHFVCANTQEVEKVGSQLRALARVLYSTCPAYGARLVAAVLNNDQSRAEWEAQCKAMADRLNSVRASLYQALIDFKVKGTWKHVIEQRGMFSYTGIPAAVVARLKNEHHIYMLSNGRISLAGLNSSNTIRFAEKLALILGTNDE
jgi:aspartate/tyrosine/aromatic aminotransferase